jgi:hypothetical protein
MFWDPMKFTMTLKNDRKKSFTRATSDPKVISPEQDATAFEREAHQHRNPFCSAPHNATTITIAIFFLLFFLPNMWF